ncbi:hypothetical protein [Pseudomarimonas arenosa]|uniref:Lipoprotein n=1 Tax=Pseudomarimonas arenosa TaxID=2774145 RepID=A0AAW3ZWA3_9GAMM|nr:hypothetical protein [Pseudomarimonas arenosa]MBD8528296.1 hypothetical protein [Pseudomarimonas arenosa]
MTRLLFLVCLLACSGAFACIGKISPRAEDLDTYESVFVAQVVGIRLSGYIEAREERGPDFWTDTTLPYDLEVLLLRSIKGEAEAKQHLEVGGCGVQIPRAGESGIFAVTESGKVIALYESERGYDGALVDIASCAAGRCRHIERPR